MTKLSCEMDKTCTNPVTHIGNKGYIYCKDHAATRKERESCRAMRKWELKLLQEGKQTSYYLVPQPGVVPKTAAGAIRRYGALLRDYERRFAGGGMFGSDWPTLKMNDEALYHELKALLELHKRLTTEPAARVTKRGGGMANPCTKCGKPGIPGLVKGQGKCQYHWNVGAYGQAWANKVRAESVPTQEQLKALLDFAAENGRGWKVKLDEVWMKASGGPHLQQVRNNFGPSWLQRTTLKQIRQLYEGHHERDQQPR